MHLRRALLLFAIVLGLAALAASVSRPGDERAATSPPPARVPPAGEPKQPTVIPADLPRPMRELSIEAARDQTRRLDTGRAATLEVSVDEPGLVEIPALSLSAAADPLTPARFEILPYEVRRYGILFTPAAGDEARPAGTLIVTPAEG